ncbi:MAG: nicotinamide-nucleotide amidase [Pseudohongiellaceae bacterium]|jgi:nicotinamide-nucleotide amidase
MGDFEDDSAADLAGPGGRGSDGRGSDGRGSDGRGSDGRGSDGRAPGGVGARQVVLLSVGDELLAGDLVDTNAQWLAALCAERGHRVVAQATVGDRIPEIELAVRRAREDGDLAIITGGLGPTADDLTRDGVAAALQLDLEERSELIDELQARMQGRDLTAGSRRQAEMPQGATSLANPIGTAPGVFVDADGFSVAVLPGVPSEMKAMATALFDEMVGRGNLQAPLCLYGAGLPESEAGKRLGELMDPAVAGCRVGITVSLGRMKITVRGEDAVAMQRAADEAARRLGETIYSRDDGSLAEICVAKLTDMGRVVSCAESCTGGLLAAALTSVSGSSAVFRQSAVTYANSVKEMLLGVSPQLLKAHGAVSEPVALAMAEGQLRASGADVAVSITGIAGPDGGTAAKPVGTVYFAVADNAGSVARLVSWPGSRGDIRGRSVNMALDLLRRRLFGVL